MASIRQSGGVSALRDLLRCGHCRDAVERAARNGYIARLRAGVYSTQEAHPDLVRAARIGGRLAGASAAKALGWWSPPDHPLVVEVPRWAANLGDPDDSSRRLDLTRSDVRVMWTSTNPTRFGVSPALDAVRQIVATEPLPYAVAVIDSALRSGSLERIELESIILSAPTACRRLLRVATGVHESGTESVLAVHLAMAGLPVRAQAPVPLTALDRFDFLVGDRLVVECDSHAHHSNSADRLRDLRRDALAAGWGFVVLRFDYAQVMFDIETVMSTIRSCVGRGEHVAMRGR